MLAEEKVDAGAIEHARGQVRKWVEGQLCSAWYINRWTDILSGTGRDVAGNILCLKGEDAKALFQNTPFGAPVRQYLSEDI